MNSSLRISFAFLCALRIAMSEKSAFLAKLFLRARGTAIRQHHAWSRGFCFAQRTRRARSNNGKGDPPRTLSPRPAPLRAPVPSGTVLVAACRARPWNLTFGTRCFEQETTERTEQRWTWSISPFPLWPPVQIVCLVAAGRAVTLREKLRIMEPNEITAQVVDAAFNRSE
jgi:hypothetical protein